MHSGSEACFEAAIQSEAKKTKSHEEKMEEETETGKGERQ
jgi:hypothetical protein